MNDEHRTLADTARSLLGMGSALQSHGGVEPIKPERLLHALELYLNRLQPSDPAVLAAAAAQVMRNADQGLQKSAPDGDATLSDTEFDSLEIIVQVLGRPALRLPRGKVQGPATDLGANSRWIILLGEARSHINRVASSVARLNRMRSDGREEQVGTAWRLGTDLVVTNRHVAEKLVQDATLDPGQWVLDVGCSCIADFGAVDEPEGTVRFVVASLAYCAPKGDVDVAVLRLQPSCLAFPCPLAVSFDEARLGREVDGEPPTFKGQPVYVVGHPLLRLPTAESLRVFGDADGRKRFSPGYSTGMRRAASAVDHDCSTLGGSSGSAVFDVYEHRVVGIHLGGGGNEPGNATGTFNRAVATALLDQHPLGGILKHGLP
nr:serine protease [uncultured Albidiferax sp.]